MRPQDVFQGFHKTSPAWSLPVQKQTESLTMCLPYEAPGGATKWNSMNF